MTKTERDRCIALVENLGDALDVFYGESLEQEVDDMDIQNVVAVVQNYVDDMNKIMSMSTATVV